LKSKKRLSYKEYKRKVIIRRYIAAAITVLFTAAVVLSIIYMVGFLTGNNYDNGFIPSPFGRNVSKRVKIAEKLELPDWIDPQIINIHPPARTGIKLKDIDNIVVHYVGNPASTAQNNRDYFAKATTSVSSHFVVGLEGEIIQCVPLYEKSAASNQRNKDSISIEVCHPDETGKFNETTYNSLVKLVSWLCDEFSLDESQIIRHYDITGKECPRYYVKNEDEWKKFKADVEEFMNED